MVSVIRLFIIVVNFNIHFSTTIHGINGSNLTSAFDKDTFSVAHALSDATQLG